MSLYDVLLSAGLPVIDMDENGYGHFGNLTDEQTILLSDLIMQYRFPDKYELMIVERQSIGDAVTNYAVLPDWIKTWTADDASTYVHDNVLSGLDVAGVDAYVDNLPNTVAGMKTGLKQIGSALVAIRDILEIIAKLLMYIRDLVIRFRQ